MEEEAIKEATMPADAGGDAAVHAPADELARKDKHIADLEGQLKRLAADFENFRRRQSQEREELIKFAAGRVFENLMPVVDNFERALTSSRQATEVPQVVTGIELIYRQMLEFLTKSGVAPMEATGTLFDPNLHEAIAQLETDTVPDQTILAEIQKGYFLNGKVLRHAMVQVANNPHGQAPSNESPLETTTEAAPAAPANQAADSDKEDNHE